MYKMRKLLTVLLSGAMLLGLCACGGGGQTADNAPMPTQWQKVADVAALELLVDEVNDDYAVQIPQFAEVGENAALIDMNVRLQQIAMDYENSKSIDGESWEILPLVQDTDHYLSVVMYQAQWPAYGTDGAVSAYMYDKVLKSEVDADLACSLARASDDDIADALADYCVNEMDTEDVEYRWIAFNVDGYYMDADGKMALIVNTSIKTKAENADLWDYLLVYKDGKIVSRLIDDLEQVR